MALETIDTTKTYEIFGNPIRLLGLLAGALGFVALGAFFVSKPEVFGGARGLTLILLIGWSAIIFFGLCALMGVLQLLKSKTPVVTISPQGFRDVRVASDTIPWDSIQNVSTFTTNGQRMLLVEVDPIVEANLNLSLVAKVTRGANAKLGADGLCSTMVGMDTSYPDFLNMVEAFMRENHSISQHNDTLER